MRAFKLQSHVGADGILRLEVSVDEKDRDLEIVVVVQASERAGLWPDRFFDETFGAFKDHPLERPPQGEYEPRIPASPT
jgi:hypothetical protein